MKRYCELRDNLSAHVSPFNHLDTPRVVKYAYGLVTVPQKLSCNTSILVYLYPEPLAWPEDSYNSSERTEHRQEIEQFAEQAIEACKQSSKNLNHTAIAVWIGTRSLAVVLFLYISMKIIAYAYITS